MKKGYLILILLYAFEMRASTVCIVIDTPGTYEFSSIEAFPTDPDDCVISVEADDVVITFNDEFITQDPGSPFPGFSGIRVQDGLSNIIIKNVVIKFLTGKGIEVGQGCQNILLENVSIQDCDEGGILFAGSMSDRIINGDIKNCLVTSCTGANGDPAYGIRLIECDNVNVIDSIFNKNDAGTSNAGFGLSLEHCNACKVINCSGNNNGGNALGAGISLYQGDWNLIENCKILNTISRAAGSAKASGILVDQALHTVIKNCIVKHSNNLLAQAYGFESCNGTNNLFQACITKNNSGATQAAGFYFHGNELRSGIMKSKSRSNDGGVSGSGFGILLDSAQNCDIVRNQLMSNMGATGIGLRDTVVNTTNLIARNIAFGNDTQGFDVTRLAGSFPVVIAQVGDFSPTTTASDFYNVDFILGPI